MPGISVTTCLSPSVESPKFSLAFHHRLCEVARMKFGAQLFAAFAAVFSMTVMLACPAAAQDSATTDSKAATVQRKTPPRYVVPEFPDEAFVISVAADHPARHCLKQSQHGKQAPDWRELDWDQLRSTQKANNCLEKVFTILNDVNLSKAWLEFHTFDVGEPFTRRIPEKDAAGRYLRRTVLNSRLSLKDKAPKLPLGLLDRIPLFRPYAQTIQINWNPDFSIKSVNAINLYK